MLDGDLRAPFEADLAAVADPERREEWRRYLEYHARRYATLRAHALDLLAGRDKPRVLNVGPMFETRLLRDA
jgi:hypothetical protein